jgi:GDPmannose 4,6-dehydratase
MKKISLISGCTGQDGSYLIDHLLSLGYVVHGIIRRSSSFNTSKIDHIINSKAHGSTFFMHHGDLTDSNNINKLVSEIKPNEFYNLGAMSHVKVSFEVPEYTANVDALGPMRVVEAVRMFSPETKVYNAATSEMFGGQIDEMPKNGFDEECKFHPRSPYGVAKLYGHWICRNYKEAYNLFVCNGILFNHSSPRRGETFLTRKVTLWCSNNFHNLKNNLEVRPLEIGNLNAMRDEGHAKDYVKAMHMMLQCDKPNDYVVSMGETHSVREWIEKCFKYMGLNLRWEGNGIKEIGLVNDKIAVVVNPKYFRPSEVDILLGNSSKIRSELKWKPTFSFDDLVNDMMEHDISNYNKI